MLCLCWYGPYQFPEKLILLMIANTLNDKPFPVCEKKENVRDWLYVEVHCKAVDLNIHKGQPLMWPNLSVHRLSYTIDFPVFLYYYIFVVTGFSEREFCLFFCK